MLQISKDFSSQKPLKPPKKPRTTTSGILAIQKENLPFSRSGQDLHFFRNFTKSKTE